MLPGYACHDSLSDINGTFPCIDEMAGSGIAKIPRSKVQTAARGIAIDTSQ